MKTYDPLTGKIKRVPLFQCQECGKKFYTVKDAERASFGIRGCPKCGGVDIESYMPRQGESRFIGGR